MSDGSCAELLLLFDPHQVSFGICLPSRANFVRYLFLQPKMEPSAGHIFTFLFFCKLFSCVELEHPESASEFMITDPLLTL